MIDIEDQHREIVTQILQQFVPGVPVWVFGSRITGKAKPYSDLDLVIVAEQKIPQACYYQIQDAFEESALPYRVDVLDWHRISESFRQVIRSNYEVLGSRMQNSR